MYMNNIVHLLLLFLFSLSLSQSGDRRSTRDFSLSLSRAHALSLSLNHSIQSTFRIKKKKPVQYDEYMSPFVRLSNEVDQTPSDIDLPRMINILMLS